MKIEGSFEDASKAFQRMFKDDLRKSYSCLESFKGVAKKYSVCFKED